MKSGTKRYTRYVSPGCSASRKKFTIRLPSDLASIVASRAQESKTSINDLVISLLEKELESCK